MSINKEYGVGLLLTIFGGSGIAEHVTSGRGSFMFSVIIFAIGFALVLDSYVRKK